MTLMIVVIAVVPVLIVVVGNVIRVKVLSALMVLPIALLVVVAWSQLFENLSRSEEFLGTAISFVACTFFLSMAHREQQLVGSGHTRRTRMAQVRQAIRAEKEKTYRMEVES